MLDAQRARLPCWFRLRVYGDGLKLVLSQDITERERARKHAPRFRGQCVARNPHAANCAQWLHQTLDALPLTEVERKRVIGLMAQQADRMRGLVSDLLTLAQIEGSPRPASDRWLKVADLLKRVENDGLALSRERHPMTFTIDARASPWRLLALKANG